MRWLGKGILAAVATLAAGAATAADLPTEKPALEPVPLPALPSTWHFAATIDGWAPSLSASLGVRNLPALPVYANIFQLLPHLEGYIPVSLVAYNENFSRPPLGPPGPRQRGAGALRRERRPDHQRDGGHGLRRGENPDCKSRLESLRNSRRALFQRERLDRLAGALWRLFPRRIAR